MYERTVLYVWNHCAHVCIYVGPVIKDKDDENVSGQSYLFVMPFMNQSKFCFLVYFLLQCNTNRGS